jgi:hypothetical protein
MTTEDEVTQPSLKRSVGLFGLLLLVGALIATFFIVSTYVVHISVGPFLAFIWFILMLAVVIGSGAVAFSHYDSQLPRRNRW